MLKQSTQRSQGGRQRATGRRPGLPMGREAVAAGRAAESLLWAGMHQNKTNDGFGGTRVRTAGPCHHLEVVMIRSRRPGESWDVWRVARDGEAVGHLVTSRDSAPRPIAYVPGESIDQALAIRNGGPIRGRGVVDLRSVLRRKSMPAILTRSMLWPVDTLGRIIGHHSTFACGKYVVPSRHAPRGSFMLFTQGSEAKAERAKACFQEKRPRTVNPNAPVAGKLRSDRAEAVAAA